MNHAANLQNLKIISGGQTGVDRAALDWAIAHGIPHGGYCPLGRLAEDGSIPAQYQLQEFPLADYAARTEQNVLAADGTVIFTLKTALLGGTLLTAQYAQKWQKPLLHLAQETVAKEGAQKLLDFLTQHHIQVLNVAGPRASEAPGIETYVKQTLESLLQ